MAFHQHYGEMTLNKMISFEDLLYMHVGIYTHIYIYTHARGDRMHNLHEL